MGRYLEVAYRSFFVATIRLWGFCGKILGQMLGRQHSFKLNNRFLLNVKSLLILEVAMKAEK